MLESLTSRLMLYRVPVAAAGLGIATVLLRLPGALGSSFWQDEVASARIVQQPTLAAMVHRVVRTESTPPLWYGLAWATHRLGVSIHDVRLLSVAFDGLIVASIVVLASAVLGFELAVVAGGIAAVAAQLSAHGLELRAYELLALLALVFAVCLERALEKPTRQRLALVAVTVTAGLLTHYFFAFTVAAAILWLSFEPSARRARLRVLAAIVAGCCLAAPWTPWFLRQYRADHYSWIGTFSATGALATPLRLLAPVLDSRPSEWLLLLWIAVAAVVAARAGARARLIATLALVPILLAATTWALGVRVYAVRNLIETAPFLVVLVVLPLTRLRARVSLASAAAVLSIFVVAYTVNQFKADVPYKGLAAALVADGWQRSSPVAVVGGPHALTSPLEWYLPHAPDFTHRPDPGRHRGEVFAVLGAHSPARSTILDAISVDGWLVGKLPISEVRQARTRLTLLTPTPSPERTFVLPDRAREHSA
jgi:hypothetical protein